MDHERIGVVSVWVGDLSSRDSLDALLVESEDGVSRFATEFGVGWIDHDLCESLFVARPIGVAEFLGCFSYADSFLDSLLKSVVPQSTPHVNAAVLLYDFDYSLESHPVAVDGLTFVGAYRYDKRAAPRFPIPN